MKDNEIKTCFFITWSMICGIAGYTLDLVWLSILAIIYAVFAFWLFMKDE